MMDNIFQDPDNWFEHSETIVHTDVNERLAFLLESLRHEPFDMDFAENAGFSDVLINILCDFEAEKRFDELLDLKTTIKEIRPEFYDEEFVLIDDNILHYALFIDDEQLAKESFAKFVEDPIADIDIYLPLLRLVALYGKGDWVYEIVLKNYETIKYADSFVGNPHQDLAFYAFYQINELEYKKFKNTGTFDFDSWLAKLDEVDMDKFSEEDKRQFQQAFTKPIVDKNTLIADFQKNSPTFFHILGTHFMQYAYNEKGMPFVTSGVIWELMLKFWYRKGNKKASFDLKSDTFDEYCGGLSGFLSQYYCNAVGAVSGAYYVYDFLHSVGLINDSTFQNALTGIRYSQESINKMGDRRWRNGFAKYWTKPNSMADIEHQTNIQVIDEAFAKVEVIEHKKESFDNVFENFMANIGTKKLKFPKGMPPKQASKPKIFSKPKSNTEPKIPRNAPCSCGSGRKYKNCCGK